jgi:simple sugar transport system permease protein
VALSLTGGLLGLGGSVLFTYAIYSMGVPPEVNLVVKAAVVFAVCLAQSAPFRSMVLQRRNAGAQP